MLSIGTSSQREDEIVWNIYWIYNPPPTNRGNQMFTGIPHPMNAIWYLGWGVDPMYNTWMFERIYIYISNHHFWYVKICRCIFPRRWVETHGIPRKMWLFLGGASKKIHAPIKHSWHSKEQCVKGLCKNLDVPTLRIQTTRTGIGIFGVPVPFKKSRNVGVMSFLGHTCILRAGTSSERE